MGPMYYHRIKIKDTLQGSVRLFEYRGHPHTKYQIPIEFLVTSHLRRRVKYSVY